MEIAFLSRQLRAICTSEIIAQEQLGGEVARILKARLADIRAASSVTDILVGRPREIDGSYPSQFAIEIAENIFLIFSQNHNSTPLKGFEQVDWSKVNRIKILKIGELP